MSSTILMQFIQHLVQSSRGMEGGKGDIPYPFRWRLCPFPQLASSQIFFKL